MDVQPHLLNLSAFINQNLDKDLPLSLLAKRVGLSPFHFHRKFGAYFGESLHQHIKRLRLERAAFALVNGSTPVREIARDSGYKTVSAFSHAFSGFAGESPTRYRVLGTAKREQVDRVEVDEPAWIGELPPLAFAFVRATGAGRGAQRSIREAIESITSRIGPIPSDGEGVNRDFPYIAATSDLYRVSNGSDYRLDVGIEATDVPQERVDALGLQTLPGGRHARFDLHCTPAEVIERCLRAATHGLQKPGQTPRLSQYFIRFGREEPGARADDAPRDYRFYVPITG
jgi:AraC-like DNA-binding protein